MHNEIQLDSDLYYIGGSDRRIHLFENVYPLTNGVSYNSYLYLDEKTLLLDTVDRAVSDPFYDNLEYLLKDRPLNYLIVNHMEPDHAANIGELLLRHPETVVVVNAMSRRFLLNYFPKIKCEFLVVKEGDTLSIGKRNFTFVMAPMVHWPEVMFTFETTSGTLFSADAFGTFGALNGDIYASDKNFDRAEARRYYTNIVGKYGDQVMAVLRKASTIDIKRICPLHGPIHQGNEMANLIALYATWASYLPEDKDGVMIAYSSVYGDTANVAEILGKEIVKRGAKNLVIYDVSKTDSSVLVSESFRVKTIVLCATTYNAGVFVKMEDFLHDLANHAIRNRTIAFVENGSWAPAAKANMQRILSGLKDITIIEESLTIASSIKDHQLPALEQLADKIAGTVLPPAPKKSDNPFDPGAMYKLSYGLFAVFTKDENGKDNASINNSYIQVSDDPKLLLLSVNVVNYTAETIRQTKKFTISVLSEEAEFSLFKRFGFQSGRAADKMVGIEDMVERGDNGLLHLTAMSNAYLSCEVTEVIECGNHVLFVARPVEGKVLSNAPSATYAYYHANIKPKPLPQPKAEEGTKKKVGWRCKICGYTYWGETLPEGFVCPLCKHPASDFERIEE